MIEVRCLAPHPDFPGSQCRKLLASCDGPGITYRAGGERIPGALVIRCQRCGTETQVYSATQPVAQPLLPQPRRR